MKLLALPLVLAAGTALAEAPEAGATAARAFLDGEAAALWDRMTPDLRAVLGTPQALRDLRTDLAAAFGTETALLSTETRTEGAAQVFDRRSAWSGSDQPLQILVSLDSAGRVAGFLVRPVPQPADSPYLAYRTKADLHLPVTGDWQVIWGGRSIDQNYHAADPGQRFALDLLVMRDGTSHDGDPARRDSYHCWDQPILAPAPGVVLRAEDGLPDQPIGSTDARRPLGNHVVLDLGAGEYAFLAHLRQGSVAVAPGAEVTRGQRLGRCGNSGNSTEPHLHLHLQTTPELGRGFGLPAQFQDYVADGAAVARGEPERGQTIRPAP